MLLDVAILLLNSGEAKATKTEGWSCSAILLLLQHSLKTAPIKRINHVKSGTSDYKVGMFGVHFLKLIPKPCSDKE